MARRKVSWTERRRWTRKDLEELSQSPETLRGLRNHPKALVRIAHATARQIEKQRRIFSKASKDYGKNLGAAFENLLGTTNTKRLAALSEAEINAKGSLFRNVARVMSAVAALNPAKVVNDVGRYVNFMEDMAERINGSRASAWDPTFSWTNFWKVYDEFMAQNPALAEMVEGGTNEIQAQLYTTMYGNGSMTTLEAVNALSERLQEREGIDEYGNIRLDINGKPVGIPTGISTGNSNKWRQIYGKPRRFP